MHIHLCAAIAIISLVAHFMYTLSLIWTHQNVT